jgi:hypothetical protein
VIILWKFFRSPIKKSRAGYSKFGVLFIPLIMLMLWIVEISIGPTGIRGWVDTGNRHNCRTLIEGIWINMWYEFYFECWFIRLFTMSVVYKLAVFWISSGFSYDAAFILL